MLAIFGLVADGPIALQVPELFDRSVAGTEIPPTRTADEDGVYTAALNAASELRALLEAHTSCPEGMTFIHSIALLRPLGPPSTLE